MGIWVVPGTGSGSGMANAPQCQGHLPLGEKHPAQSSNGGSFEKQTLEQRFFKTLTPFPQGARRVSSPAIWLERPRVSVCLSGTFKGRLGLHPRIGASELAFFSLASRTVAGAQGCCWVLTGVCEEVASAPRGRCLQTGHLVPQAAPRMPRSPGKPGLQ